MTKVYLCDDNEIILEKYKKLLLSIAQEYHITVNLMTFTSGEQLLFHMEEANDVDIIYLDILMAGQNGLEIARELRSSGSGCEIIFLTANPEYVFDSFDVSPTHYILKDSITEKRFREIFFKAVALAEEKNSSFFPCANGSVQKQIPISLISYFEVQNRIITVHYADLTFDFYGRMEDLEKAADLGGFIRVHRSYLVHLKYINQLNKNTILLITGQTIPLGGTYAKNVKAALARYLNLFH